MDLDERLKAAADACTRTAIRSPRVPPGAAFAALASACEELGIDEWDVYGDGGAVARVEAEVADLLGKPAAVFFPSGVMGQQAALRAWCERTGSTRVAIPDRSHLLVHEDDGPRLLHGFRFEHLTIGRRTATAADLRGLPRGLGAALVELPLRDAGCRLPSWEELVALSEAARELGVPLHADGARIWESQPFYDRPLAEIAALADSMYVSFYKGLGGPAGAAVAGPADLADELRLWRRRMGGTLFRLTPYAVGALVGLRDLLPRMGEYAAWARSLAALLADAGLTVDPDPPHTNTFLVHAPGPAEAINERLLAFLERESVVPSGSWWDAPVPGFATTEVAVQAASLDFEPAVVAGWWREIVLG
ncbi:MULTISPECIES: threonine aldolase family protein [unclassified Nocardioides]|uniref:threonine aldolase family protein n=1 Tax=Nocardioides sp. URHA0032 TaxID=1380388 RepID=UPI000565093B|nr:beta-eliminating lyase-related protein [Nocardioides sp. URHA0032]